MTRSISAEERFNALEESFVGGTFTANGATPVEIANPRVTENSVIVISVRPLPPPAEPADPAQDGQQAPEGQTVAAATEPAPALADAPPPSGGPPVPTQATIGVGFTAIGTAGDTGIYNYLIIG